MRRINHWLDGQLTPGTSGRAGPVFNPATGAQTAEVDFASAAEVDAVVASARTAQAGWRSLSLARRGQVLFKMRDLVAANGDRIAAAITAEHGKVHSDAFGEVTRGLENLEFACGAPEALKGSFSEQVSSGVDVYSIRQPVGVMAGITPFNFPAMVPLWMFSTAIACGNAFILKPSEKDPSASLILAELWAEAGLPPGVFSVLQGDRVAVDALIAHPGVDAVSFVGSTPIARSVYEAAARHGKRVQALGGAKNHMVVLPDADIDLAADAAVSAGYGSAGERCMAVSVVVAVGAVADPLVDAIATRVAKIAVGPGDQADSEIGPLVTAAHRDKVAAYLEPDALDGARVVVDGRATDVPREGFFLAPSLIDGLRPGSRAYDDEIFGPVLSVIRVDHYDDAVALINDNPYGNGVALFTRDGGVARQFQFEIEAGMVGINVPIPVPVGYYSFGGWNSSLFGDTHIYGPEGIRFCTRTKVVTSRWPNPATSAVDLGFPRT